MDLNLIGPTYRADAPAKLNLFLEVMARRDDGFHEIETLMVAISLRDTLYFTETQEPVVQLSCDWTHGLQARHGALADRGVSNLGDLPRVRNDARSTDNLVWRALSRFRDAAGVTRGGAIRIVKRVPAAAGLGGASSDAAAALRLANSAWKVGWNDDRLSQFAAEIGCDVPFFLRQSAFAICRGRGEQIEHYHKMTPLHLIVARPPVGLSTAAVYSQCQPAAEPRSADAISEALRTGSLCNLGRQLFNRLESAAAALAPWVGRLRDTFARLDLLGFRMSGSGSSFFGICRDRRHARRVANSLRALGVGEVLATSSTPPRCHLTALST